MHIIIIIVMDLMMLVGVVHIEAYKQFGHGFAFKVV
jgi:hypothetical protein